MSLGFQSSIDQDRIAPSKAMKHRNSFDQSRIGARSQTDFKLGMVPKGDITSQQANLNSFAKRSMRDTKANTPACGYMTGDGTQQTFLLRGLMENIFSRKKKATAALKASEVDTSDINKSIPDKTDGDKKKKKKSKKAPKPIKNEDRELCREDGGDEDFLAEVEQNDAYCSPFTGVGLGRYENSEMDDEMASEDDDDFDFDAKYGFKDDDE